MELINYKDLGLKISDDVNTFTFNDKKIEVFKYLNIRDKYDLLMTTLQKSAENGIYNDLKVDMYFHLNLVYMYSNLVFEDEDREDEMKLYDELIDSGFMEAFLGAMEESEYTGLYNFLNEIMFSKSNYNKTIAGMFDKLSNSNISEEVEEALNKLKDFNAEDYENLKSLAESAGLRAVK